MPLESCNINFASRFGLDDLTYCMQQVHAKQYMFSGRLHGETCYSRTSMARTPLTS